MILLHWALLAFLVAGCLMYDLFVLTFQDYMYTKYGFRWAWLGMLLFIADWASCILAIILYLRWAI